MNEFEKSTEFEFRKALDLSGKKLKHVSEILKVEYQEENFLIEKLIPHPSISMVSGFPGSGKTWFLLKMAKCLAGEAFFLNSDFQIKENCGVGIFEEENGEKELKKRLLKLGLTENTSLPIFISSFSGLKIDKKDELEFILEETALKNLKVVFLDPFIAFHSQDENRAEDMAKVMSYLNEFVKEGISVITTHHHRKEAGWYKSPFSHLLRGSTAIFGRIDCHLVIEKRKDLENGFEFVVYQEKLRNAPRINPFKVVFKEENEVIKLEYAGEYLTDEKVYLRLKNFIINNLENKQGVKRKDLLEIIRAEGFSIGTFSRVIRDLKDEGLVEAVREGKEVIYRLKEKDSSGLFSLDLVY
ncbi:MAG: AAA family ATPase [candidate division WOR-3 bacterium]